MATIGIDENGDIDVSRVSIGSQEVYEKLHIAIATIKGTVEADLDYGIDIQTAFQNDNYNLTKMITFLESEIKKQISKVREVIELRSIQFTKGEGSDKDILFCSLEVLFEGESQPTTYEADFRNPSIPISV